MVAGNRMTDTERDMVVDFGAFMYTAERMESILAWPKNAVAALMADRESEFYQLYQKGVHLGEFVMHRKLFEMAQKGDIKAFEKIELIRRLNERNAKK